LSEFVFGSPSEINSMLENYLHELPLLIDQDNPEGGVLRPWVRVLPLRLQGVLLTAIRGCDGAPKEDNSKAVSRMVRRACLNPADPRESLNSGGFFGFAPDKEAAKLRDFFHSLDQYPLHYVMHLCHSCEVIGYAHPDEKISRFYVLLYHLFCHTMHLRPEPRDEMFGRLTADRVAAGTTARNF
jgi:hypothetical protein